MNRDLNLKKIQLVSSLKLRGAIENGEIEKAFLEIPREEFVPEEEKDLAYLDSPLSIGFGQTISQPFMVAYMTSKLNPQRDDIVLEIGTGSGYQAAILSKLVKRVYTVERIPELAERAKKVFEKLKLENISVKVGDGTLGWKEYSPYDKIIVTAGSPEIPQSLVAQLKDGGIMVIPVGASPFLQTLKIITKSGDGKIRVKDDIKCVFVKLLGKEGW